MHEWNSENKPYTIFFFVRSTSQVFLFHSKYKTLYKVILYTFVIPIQYMYQVSTVLFCCFSRVFIYKDAFRLNVLKTCTEKTLWHDSKIRLHGMPLSYI